MVQLLFNLCFDCGAIVAQSLFFSLPIGWRAEIVNDGNIPDREEYIFGYELNMTDVDEKVKYGYLKEKGRIRMREAFVTGFGIPHEKNTCRTWDGRSPLQKCKFPFKVHVRAPFYQKSGKVVHLVKHGCGCAHLSGPENC